MAETNTHHLRISFGKHGPSTDNPKGTLYTRIPVNYLQWMVNNNTREANLARSELLRRGSKMPTVQLSGHAIDNASLRTWVAYMSYRNDGEGLYSWLCRMVEEALAAAGGEIKEAYFYNDLKLIIEIGEEFPVLKTIMLAKEK